MTPRTLLTTGLGLLVLGLLLVLGVDDTATEGSQQSAAVLSYLAGACSLTGSGLVVAAAVVKALRPRTTQEPPAVDHWA